MGWRKVVSKPPRGSRGALKTRGKMLLLRQKGGAPTAEELESIVDKINNGDINKYAKYDSKTSHVEQFDIVVESAELINTENIQFQCKDGDTGMTKTIQLSTDKFILQEENNTLNSIDIRLPEFYNPTPSTVGLKPKPPTYTIPTDEELVAKINNGSIKYYIHEDSKTQDANKPCFIVQGSARLSEKDHSGTLLRIPMFTFNYTTEPKTQKPKTTWPWNTKEMPTVQSWYPSKGNSIKCIKGETLFSTDSPWQPPQYVDPNATIEEVTPVKTLMKNIFTRIRQKVHSGGEWNSGDKFNVEVDGKEYVIVITRMQYNGGRGGQTLYFKYYLDDNTPVDGSINMF
jgi:hypothetical protein